MRGSLRSRHVVTARCCTVVLLEAFTGGLCRPLVKQSCCPARHVTLTPPGDVTGGIFLKLSGDDTSCEQQFEKDV